MLIVKSPIIYVVLLFMSRARSKPVTGIMQLITSSVPVPFVYLHVLFLLIPGTHAVEGTSVLREPIEDKLRANYLISGIVTTNDLSNSIVDPNIDSAIQYDDEGFESSLHQSLPSIPIKFHSSNQITNLKSSGSKLLKNLKNSDKNKEHSLSSKEATALLRESNLPNCSQSLSLPSSQIDLIIEFIETVRSLPTISIISALAESNEVKKYSGTVVTLKGCMLAMGIVGKPGSLTKESLVDILNCTDEFIFLKQSSMEEIISVIHRITEISEIVVRGSHRKSKYVRKYAVDELSDSNVETSKYISLCLKENRTHNIKPKTWLNSDLQWKDPKKLNHDNKLSRSYSTETTSRIISEQNKQTFKTLSIDKPFTEVPILTPGPSFSSEHGKVKRLSVILNTVGKPKPQRGSEAAVIGSRFANLNTEIPRSYFVEDRQSARRLQSQKFRDAQQIVQERVSTSRSFPFQLTTPIAFKPKTSNKWSATRQEYTFLRITPSPALRAASTRSRPVVRSKDSTSIEFKTRVKSWKTVKSNRYQSDSGYTPSDGDVETNQDKVTIENFLENDLENSSNADFSRSNIATSRNRKTTTLSINKSAKNHHFPALQAETGTVETVKTNWIRGPREAKTPHNEMSQNCAKTLNLSGKQVALFLQFMETIRYIPTISIIADLTASNQVKKYSSTVVALKSCMVYKGIVQKSGHLTRNSVTDILNCTQEFLMLNESSIEEIISVIQNPRLLEQGGRGHFRRWNFGKPETSPKTSKVLKEEKSLLLCLPQQKTAQYNISEVNKDGFVNQIRLPTKAVKFPGFGPFFHEKKHDLPEVLKTGNQENSTRTNSENTELDSMFKLDLAQNTEFSKSLSHENHGSNIIEEKAEDFMPSHQRAFIDSTEAPEDKMVAVNASDVSDVNLGESSFNHMRTAYSQLSLLRENTSSIDDKHLQSTRQNNITHLTTETTDELKLASEYKVHQFQKYFQSDVLSSLKENLELVNNSVPTLLDSEIRSFDDIVNVSLKNDNQSIEEILDNNKTKCGQEQVSNAYNLTTSAAEPVTQKKLVIKPIWYIRPRLSRQKTAKNELTPESINFEEIGSVSHSKMTEENINFKTDIVAINYEEVTENYVAKSPLELSEENVLEVDSPKSFFESLVTSGVIKVIHLNDSSSPSTIETTKIEKNYEKELVTHKEEVKDTRVGSANQEHGIKAQVKDWDTDDSNQYQSDVAYINTLSSNPKMAVEGSPVGYMNAAGFRLNELVMFTFIACITSLTIAFSLMGLACVVRRRNNPAPDRRSGRDVTGDMV